MTISMDVRRWLEELQEAVRALEKRNGRPLSRNTDYIGPPADPAELQTLISAELVVSESPLLDLYRHSAGICLMSFWNGYHIYPPSLLLRARESGEPYRIQGLHEREILMFGSDGGGNRFALEAGGVGEVLYLGAGAVLDGVFIDDTPTEGGYPFAFRVAATLEEFLNRVLADIEAYLSDNPDWTFIDHPFSNSAR